MKAKQIGVTIDRNPAKHMSKPRNSVPKMRKLIDSGRLIPIYQATEDTIFLIGYQRKTTSRKAHQRPFMLKAAVPIARITPNADTESCNTESKK